MRAKKKQFFTRSSRRMFAIVEVLCVSGDIWRWRAELATLLFFCEADDEATATLRPLDVKAQQSATWARVAAERERERKSEREGRSDKRRRERKRAVLTMPKTEPKSKQQQK